MSICFSQNASRLAQGLALYSVDTTVKYNLSLRLLLISRPVGVGVLALLALSLTALALSTLTLLALSLLAMVLGSSLSLPALGLLALLALALLGLSALTLLALTLGTAALLGIPVAIKAAEERSGFQRLVLDGSRSGASLFVLARDY